MLDQIVAILQFMCMCVYTSSPVLDTSNLSSNLSNLPYFTIFHTNDKVYNLK